MRKRKGLVAISRDCPPAVRALRFVLPPGPQDRNPRSSLTFPSGIRLS